jgi:hypothetical protein
MPFVPINSVCLGETGAVQPTDTHTAGSGNPNPYQDSLGSQLHYEQQQHLVTKHMLRSEQEKVQKLQAELDDSKRMASALVVANRLNAEVLKAAVHRIEPNVDNMVKKMNLLTVAQDAAYHGAVEFDGGSDEKPDNDVRSSTTSTYWGEGSPQLPAPNVNDQRPSILYDVLMQHKVNEFDNIPDFHRSIQNEAEYQGPGEEILQRANGTDHEGECAVHRPTDQASCSLDGHANTVFNKQKLDIQGPTLSEFHSLDEAFESEFFPKKGIETCDPLPRKEMSDDTLIEFLPERNASSKSEVVNRCSSGSVTSKLRQHQSCGEDLNTSTVNPVAIEGSTSIAAEPILGVETVSRAAFCKFTKMLC